MAIATIKYFAGEQELKDVFTLGHKRFTAIGGAYTRHNRYGFVGHPTDGPDAWIPVDRTIEYQRNPSLHKCDARCMHAKGRTCECSCGGKNHGLGIIA